MTEMAERIKEIEARKEELRTELEGAEITPERASEIQEEARTLGTEEKEIRAKMSLKDQLKPGQLVPQDMTENEQRAQSLVDTHKIEMRAAVLSTGTIAKPTKVDGINGMAEGISSIVDDVKAVSLTGNGAYTVAYKKANATASDLVDGDEITESEADFDYVTINPVEWATTGRISKQVAKVSPLNYLATLEESALSALRKRAEAKIFAAIQASSLLDSKVVAFGPGYLRSVALGSKPIAGKGGFKLYLTQADLLTLGEVRGTNEKKALYEISFSDEAHLNGTITEGGLAVNFSITEALADGTQIYGQPKTVEMPMWDNYAIETDESVFFTKNLIAYRGVQTANADLCAVKGMTKITQA